MRLSLRQRRDRAAIGFHYDVSNDFYALFLDRRMVYSCAYYRRPDGDLEQAQEDKLDLVCRKLRLAPGERFLDLGCGWGSLVLWAAARYGVDAYGVTLSAAQAEWAQAAIRRAGLEGRARVECLDYRDLSTGLRFDKVAAIGLIEHVGVDQYPAYFSRVQALLERGGLLLNQGITHERHWQRSTQAEFLHRYVFPNAEFSNVSHMLDAIEGARFEVLDVEGLRPHYARTTRQWVERLQVNAPRACSLVGERTYRTWLTYLAAASVAFVRGDIGLYQILVARPAPGMGHVPMARRLPAVALTPSIAGASGPGWSVTDQG